VSSRSRRDKAARRRRGQMALAPVISMPERPPVDSSVPGWTPLELLETFIAEVKSGKETATSGMMLFWFEACPDGRRRPAIWHSNMSVEEQLAVIEVAKVTIIRHWQEG